MPIRAEARVAISTARRSCPAGTALLLARVLSACSDTTSPPIDNLPARIRVVAGDTQFAAPAMAVRTPPVVEVQNAAGRPLPGVTVEFQIGEGGGWTSAATVATDAGGRATTAWYLGPAPGSAHRLVATIAGGSVATSLHATALPLDPDSTYSGRNGYIEFAAGDLPLVLSAPHGGTLLPSELPDRTSGETVTDVNTIELARAIADEFEQRTGKRPYLVLCRLGRTKLDANREIGEAAQGNAGAEIAWREWHGFLQAARAAVESGGTGLYIDLHGHGHAIARLELGYLLSAGELGLSDAQLNTSSLIARSSVRALAARAPAGLAGLLRGPESLGSLLAARGFPAVPSQSQPGPGTGPYFSGGYDTERHGSHAGGQVDAIQIEAHRVGVRDTEASRTAFAKALVAALQDYFVAHYDRSLN
jgi:hypothetical protein